MKSTQKVSNSQSKTKLTDHQFTGKKLIPPLATIPMTPSSWIDTRMPQMLWAVLLTNAFSREEVLERFENVVDVACEVSDTKDPNWRTKPLIVTLAGIASLDVKDKQKLMQVIAPDEKAKEALLPMLFFDNFPDKKQWESILKKSPSKTDWNKLAEAIAGCFDHQSQKATDCRWVKALYVVKSGYISFTANATKTPHAVLDYPTHNEEELRFSRPGVRALEIGLGNGENEWSEHFWQECFEKTGCIPRTISEDEIEKRYPSHEQLVEEKKKLNEINQGLTDHFWKTAKGSDRDPKHEVGFGIALYAADLATSTILLGMGRTSQGRMVLRSLVECLISLKYLSVKDDPKLWFAFQRHGMGQAKLVIQRTEEEGRDPKYLDLKNLGQIANDDIWVEFLPIDIGSWDDSDLRKRAIEVGLKDKYDDYYTWPSSFSHGQWGAIRETIYDLCGNPLHRFHRIPLLFSLNLEEANDDIYILLNEIVSLLYKMYPKSEPDDK